MVLTQMEVLTSPDMHFLNKDLVPKETVSLSPYNLLFGSPHTMLDSIRIIKGVFVWRWLACCLLGEGELSVPAPGEASPARRGSGGHHCHRHHHHQQCLFISWQMQLGISWKHAIARQGHKDISLELSFTLKIICYISSQEEEIICHCKLCHQVVRKLANLKHKVASLHL